MSSGKKKTAKKKQSSQMPEYSFGRYVLTGAGLGGYFGFVFNPISQNPSFLLPFWMGALIALVMFFYRKFSSKGALSWGALLKRLPLDYAKYVIFLLLLQSRHLMFNAGGKIAVIFVMIIAGGLLGAWYSYSDDAFGLN